MDLGPSVPPEPTPPRHREGPRVVSVCRVLWNGGVQRVAISQVRDLRQTGWDIDLLFLRSVPGAVYALPTGTKVVDPLGAAPRGPWARLSSFVTARFAGHRGGEATVDLDLLWGARSRVAEYDLALYNDQYAALIGVYNRMRWGQPYVMMFHEFFPKVSHGWKGKLLWPLADLIDALSLLLAPAIVTTSRHVQERIERLLPGRARLARLGAPAPRDPPPIPGTRDRTRVISITVWDRGRRPELYLEIARRSPSFRFVLAGIWTDPEYMDTIRRSASALGNVEVTGPISEARREELLASSWFYMRFGFDESGPGMGGLEALAAGDLVITNFGLGIAEILDDHRNGFVVADPIDRTASELLEQLRVWPQDALERVSASAIALARGHSEPAHSAIVADALRRVARIPRSPPRSPGPVVQEDARSTTSKDAAPHRPLGGGP